MSEAAAAEVQLVLAALALLLGGFRVSLQTMALRLSAGMKWPPVERLPAVGLVFLPATAIRLAGEAVEAGLQMVTHLRAVFRFKAAPEEAVAVLSLRLDNTETAGRAAV